MPTAERRARGVLVALVFAIGGCARPGSSALPEDTHAPTPLATAAAPADAGPPLAPDARAGGDGGPAPVEPPAPAPSAPPAVALPATPMLTAPPGKALVAGPGFAFLVPAEAGAVTFDFVTPGTPSASVPLFSVTIDQPEGDVAAAVEAAIKARKTSYSEVVLSETPAKLAGAPAVELEIEATAYQGHGLERHAALQGVRLDVRCRTEEAPFDPVRALCAASLDAVAVSASPPPGPAVTAKGVHVTVPPGLEPRGAAAFTPGNEDMTGFMDVRMFTIPWTGTLDLLAREPIGVEYVMGPVKATRGHGRAGPFLEFDATTEGGAPIIRQLRRVVAAGGRGYALECDTDVGSFGRVRPRCRSLLDSLLLAP